SQQFVPVADENPVDAAPLLSHADGHATVHARVVPPERAQRFEICAVDLAGLDLDGPYTIAESHDEVDFDAVPRSEIADVDRLVMCHRGVAELAVDEVLVEQAEAVE